jgi:hypothetical protein
MLQNKKLLLHHNSYRFFLASIALFLFFSNPATSQSIVFPPNNFFVPNSQINFSWNKPANID